MKKLIVIILFFTTYTFGQSYLMTITLNDESKVTVAVDEIRKMVFDISTDVNDEINQTKVIESFKLFQNYPNPCNPSTTISYQIPDYSNVSVNVYDLNGQLVKELLNETQNAGEYKVSWDGTNQTNFKVASGVYIYSVRCNEHLLSKQMILLK